MGQPKSPSHPKSKRPARRKPDDKAQFERFVETARKLGVEEVGPEFDDAFKKIVPPKPIKIRQ
jgi:hypothetical protein